MCESGANPMACKIANAVDVGAFTKMVPSFTVSCIDVASHNGHKHLAKMLRRFLKR